WDGPANGDWTVIINKDPGGSVSNGDVFSTTTLILQSGTFNQVGALDLISLEITGGTYVPGGTLGVYSNGVDPFNPHDIDFNDVYLYSGDGSDAHPNIIEGNLNIGGFLNFGDIDLQTYNANITT